MTSDKLAILRAEIDQIDQRIVELFEHRFMLALQTTRHKKESVFDPNRETQVLERVKKAARHASPEFYEQLYRIVMAESRRLQENAGRKNES